MKSVAVMELPPGEQTKSFDRFQVVVEWMIENGIKRDSPGLPEDHGPCPAPRAGLPRPTGCAVLVAGPRLPVDRDACQCEGTHRRRKDGIAPEGQSHDRQHRDGDDRQADLDLALHARSPSRSGRTSVMSSTTARPSNREASNSPGAELLE